jgi:deoxyribonuclease V
VSAPSIAEAREIQLRLRERLCFVPPASFRPCWVAGADVAFDTRRKLAFAAVVILDMESLETVETATAVQPITFPYVPGYLSFRELPPLAAAWRELQRRPDVAVFDAPGYAHPRRLGLASHAGLEFAVPAIGCAKSVLCGRFGPLASERGAWTPLVDPKTGEEIGCAFRSRRGVRPLYLSVGHQVDLPTAREVILQLTPGGRYRFPETTRRADRLAAELKRTHRSRVS